MDRTDHIADLTATFAAAERDGAYDAALDALAETWPLLVEEHGDALRTMLDQVPIDRWEHDPSLVAAYAASYRAVRGWSPLAGLPYFAAAEAAIDRATPPTAIVTIRTHHAAALRSLGRFADALAMLDVATSTPLRQEDGPLDARVGLETGIDLQRGIALYHDGEYDGAFDSLRQAESLAAARLTRAEQVEVCSAFAMLSYSRGDFEQALRSAGDARRAANRSKLIDTPFGAGALVAETLIAVEQGRLTDAIASGDRAVQAARGSEWEPLAIYSKAAISIISERYVDGLELLRQALQVWRAWPSPGHLVTMTEGLRATLLLRLGETESAWNLLASLAPTQHHANCPARFIAHLRLASGDPQGTLDALTTCEAMGDAHSGRTLVEVLLLRAAASLALGTTGASDLAADRGFLLAARNGMRVPFRLIPEQAMSRLVERAAQRPQPAEVLALLGRASGAPTGLAPAEVLSQRERDVIRLIVDGGTVASVAEELFISANTVKTHLKSAYRKLGVDNRADAAHRARELGLHISITRG